MQELVEQLGKDMMDSAPGVQWSDIAGVKPLDSELKLEPHRPVSQQWHSGGVNGSANGRGVAAGAPFQWQDGIA